MAAPDLKEHFQAAWNWSLAASDLDRFLSSDWDLPAEPDDTMDGLAAQMLEADVWWWDKTKRTKEVEIVAPLAALLTTPPPLPTEGYPFPGRKAATLPAKPMG